MIAVKLKKLWKPAEILQKCSFCFDQSQQRSEHACKPQNHKLNYGCCLRFGFLTLDWLFPCNTITFQKYFWCLQFSEFYSSHWKVLYLTSSTLYLSYCYELVMWNFPIVVSYKENSMLAWNFYSAHTYILYTKQRKNRITQRGHHH